MASAVTSKTPSTSAQSSCQTAKTPSVKPQVVVKQVCCCNLGMKPSKVDIKFDSAAHCKRWKNSQSGKSEAQIKAEAQTPKSAKSVDKTLWKYILLKVK